MQDNLLKQVVENVVGDPALKLVELLSDNKDINEFIIAKKLGLTINQTRNLLYKLSHLGILSSTRKKDKRKGWYIYFWTLNVLRSLEILENNLEEEIGKLKLDLASKQSKRYYKCKICGSEVPEEAALLHDFMCPECGEVYVLSDTTVHVSAVLKNIAKLKRELELVRKEREEEQQKQDKKLTRIIKKVEKDKKEKRRLMSKKRKALVKRLLKKAAKSAAKKSADRKKLKEKSKTRAKKKTNSQKKKKFHAKHKKKR